MASWRNVSGADGRWTAPRGESAAADSVSEASVSDDSIQRDEAASDGAGAKAERAARESRYEGATPPGYDEWPTHGGYLGCLLGLVAACTLSGFLGGTWFAILATPSWVKATITLVIALVAFIGLGRLGWVLGKRYYREYPQPVRGEAAASPQAEPSGGATQAGDTPHA